MEPTSLSAPLTLGDLSLPSRAILAPLAGVSDVPFRRICQEHGAALTYVEMLSATALLYGNKKTFGMLARHPSESVLGVQVTGRSAEEVAQAVAILDRQGFDTIDINMGCPVKKVVSAGCGSAILRDPDRVTATMMAARAATNKPLSAKIRLGYTREETNVALVAQRIAQHADMVTIHGRTRSESYDTPVDLGGIAVGVEAARQHNPEVITLSNGDVFGQKDVTRHQQSTGADGVMVSRGALGNPWVFSSCLGPVDVHPTVAEWEAVVLRHIAYQAEHYPADTLAALLMRKHLLWYTKGFPGSKRLRERLGAVSTLDEARAEISGYARTLGPNLRRHEHLPVGSSSEGSSTYSNDPKWEMDRELDRGVGAVDL